MSAVKRTELLEDALQYLAISTLKALPKNLDDKLNRAKKRLCELGVFPICFILESDMINSGLTEEEGERAWLNEKQQWLEESDLGSKELSLRRMQAQFALYVASKRFKNSDKSTP
jgi:hypothetical protein